MVKVSLNGNTIYLRLLLIKGCDAIQPKLNCFISMKISVAKLSGFPLYFFHSKTSSHVRGSHKLIGGSHKGN